MREALKEKIGQLAAADKEWAAVVEWLANQERLEERVGGVIRSAIDAVLDGERTGRYDYAQLDRVEKTYIGLKVEHMFVHEFGLRAGIGELDTMIAGDPVDVKWTGRATRTGWNIPPEAFDQLCVLLWGNDEKSRFSLGVVRARTEWLNKGRNRDSKGTLSAKGRANIVWLIDKAPLPENVLYHLPAKVREEILSHSSGTQRIAAFFRARQGQVVSGNVIDTLGRQKDSPKRARDARKILAQEGIALLQGRWEADRLQAEQLGIKLGPDDWVAVPAHDLK